MLARPRTPGGRGAAAWLLALAAVACDEPSAGAEAQATEPTSDGTVHVSATPAARRARLPEDPQLAREASLQWNEHLAEEEEHRRLCYDRDRLDEHRVVMAELSRLREDLERARTPGALRQARARVRAQAGALRKKMQQVDPHRNSSHLVEQQEATLTLLEGPYAEARAEEQRGEPEALRKLEGVLNRRKQLMFSLAERAARCRDE